MADSDDFSDSDPSRGSENWLTNLKRQRAESAKARAEAQRNYLKRQRAESAKRGVDLAPDIEHLRGLIIEHAAELEPAPDPFADAPQWIADAREIIASKAPRWPNLDDTVLMRARCICAKGRERTAELTRRRKVHRAALQKMREGCTLFLEGSSAFLREPNFCAEYPEEAKLIEGIAERLHYLNPGLESKGPGRLVQPWAGIAVALAEHLAAEIEASGGPHPSLTKGRRGQEENEAPLPCVISALLNLCVIDGENVTPAAVARMLAKKNKLGGNFNPLPE